MKSRTLAYSHLNLRTNPFGERSPEQRARLAVVEIERFVEPLEKPGYAVQFVGPCGRGKSTHLLALHARFPEAPRIRVMQGQRTAAFPDASLLFVDGVDHLSWWSRRRLFARAQSLVLTSHGPDYQHALRRHGIDCESVAIGGVTASQLRQIFDRRIEDARRREGPIPRLTSDSIDALLHHFGDDIRAMEQHLYEIFQRLKGPADVQVLSGH